ncbi:MAG TPA: helix-turn-helix transcriptional regulator [Casimicrobiaceae bacterium]|nr:helix-turn-helix transcriptional regulator [Casimicrobiaceae bacterium]
MHASTLVEALKRMLRAREFTYAQVAQALGLSEASVKRMFARQDLSLRRLEQICRAAGIEFDDLMRAAGEEQGRITHLTVEQEQEIVSDPRLMLVALCAVGHWTFEEIRATYAMPETELTRCLVRLDRRRIIELLPGNRIRPLIARTFSWLPDGPIQHYFRDRVEREYLSSRFDRPGELLLFVSGMLGKRATEEMIARLRKVAGEFADMHNEDRSLPHRDRHGTSLMLAIRPWEPRVFRMLRRDRPDDEPAAAAPCPTPARASR